MRTFFATVVGRLALWLIRTFHLGQGSQVPGRLACAICPNILVPLTAHLSSLIYITGTNGKTTTTRFLATLLQEDLPLSNSSGANLEAGLVTALLTYPRSTTALFEVDEQVLPALLKKSPPTLLICLNLFRDQLDRYGEIDTIQRAWKQALLPLEIPLLFNGDDPLLVQMAHELGKPVHFFGLEDESAQEESAPHVLDSIHCTHCALPLSYTKVYFAHLGCYHCTQCAFHRPPLLSDSRTWKDLPARVHNRYNAVAALSAALLQGKSPATLSSLLPHLSLPPGRAEVVRIRDKTLLILLSKNPAGLNIGLSYAKELSRAGQLGGILFALNDAAADGRDLSWIWDGALEELSLLSVPLTVTGTRSDDGALCLRYFVHENCPVHSEENYKSALAHALETTPSGKTLCVMPTYTAMLQIKNYLSTVAR